MEVEMEEAKTRNWLAFWGLKQEGFSGCVCGAEERKKERKRKAGAARDRVRRERNRNRKQNQKGDSLQRGRERNGRFLRLVEGVGSRIKGY